MTWVEIILCILTLQSAIVMYYGLVYFLKRNEKYDYSDIE